MVYNGVKFGVIESLPGCGKKTVHDGGYGSRSLPRTKYQLQTCACYVWAGVPGHMVRPAAAVILDVRE